MSPQDVCKWIHAFNEITKRKGSNDSISKQYLSRLSRFEKLCEVTTVTIGELFEKGTISYTGNGVDLALYSNISHSAEGISVADLFSRKFKFDVKIKE